MGSNKVVEYLLTEKGRNHAFSQLKNNRVPYTMWDDLFQMLCLKALEKGDNVEYPSTWCHVIMLNLIRELFSPVRKLGQHWIKIEKGAIKKLEKKGYEEGLDNKLLAEEVAKRYPREVIVRYFGDDYEATRKNKMKKFRFIEQAKKDFRREESRVRLNSLARKAGAGR